MENGNSDGSTGSKLKERLNLFRCRNSFLGKWKTLEIQKVNHEKVKLRIGFYGNFLLFLLFSS